MGIILNILNILLLILGGLLAFVLIIIMAILLLPIKYKIEGSKYEEVDVKAIVNVFYIVKIIFKVQKDYQHTNVTVFGRTIYTYEDEEIETKQSEDVSSQESRQKESPSQTKRVNTEEKVNNEHKASSVQTPPKKLEQKPKTATNTRSESPKEVDKPSEEKKENGFGKIFKSIKELWEDENRYEFFGYLKDLIYQLFKTIKPKYLYFELIIGADNPADTGEWLAKSTIAYPLYAPYGTIQGNFEEKGIWGEGEVAGKLNIYQLIKPIVVFISKKSVRQYIRLIANIGKDEENVK